jgi:hypothetical protein
LRNDNEDYVLPIFAASRRFILLLDDKHETKRKQTSLSAARSATFGMGCFWEPSEELLKVDGVMDTVAGYTGNPSP